MSNVPKIQLKEMRNLGVLLTTTQEIDEYLDIRRRGGWEVNGSMCDINGSQSPYGYLQNGAIFIYASNSCGWNSANSQSKKLITLSDFKKEQGIGEQPVMPWDGIVEVTPTSKHACDDCGCDQYEVYSADLMACASCGQLQDKAQFTEIQPSKEDTTMTNVSFETKHFINGNNVESMTIDQFLTAIQGKKAQIGTLESIEIKSDVLNSQIAAQEADLALIIAKMEEIHG